MTTNILTADDLADIRAYVDRLDHSPVGIGYTGWAIAGLLATVDALQGRIDTIDAIDALITQSPA
jgi:hypothetical protein